MYSPKSTASPSLAKLDEIDPLPFRTGFRASSDVATATEEALLSGTEDRSGMFDSAVVHTHEMKRSTQTESADRLSSGFSADASDAILTSSSGAMPPSLKPPLPLKLPSTAFFDREAKKETEDGFKSGLFNKSRGLLARMKAAGTKNKQQDELFPAASSSDDMDSEYLLG
jgi:hypothetical protein